MIQTYSNKKPGDGPKDVPPEALCGHSAVGPSHSLLQVPSREQQVRIEFSPAKLALQGSHAKNVDVAMQRRRNLSYMANLLASLRAIEHPLLQTSANRNSPVRAGLQERSIKGSPKDNAPMHNQLLGRPSHHHISSAKLSYVRISACKFQSWKLKNKLLVLLPSDSAIIRHCHRIHRCIVLLFIG